MQLLDNFIKDKFLEDIIELFRQYNIKENFKPIYTLLTRLIYNKDFFGSIIELYEKHYKRNLAILEILANKQNLESERQVFNLVRNNINKNNIRLTVTLVENLYYSSIRQKIVNPLNSGYQETDIDIETLNKLRNRY